MMYIIHIYIIYLYVRVGMCVCVCVKLCAYRKRFDSHQNTSVSPVGLKFLNRYKSRVKITVRTACRMLIIIVFVTTVCDESPSSLLMDV